VDRRGCFQQGAVTAVIATLEKPTHW